jgi:hypothetical protein
MTLLHLLRKSRRGFKEAFMDNIRHSGFIVRALGAIALLAGCASSHGASTKAITPPGLQKEETSIPFVHMESSIHDWKANGQEGLWIQDGRRDWYYAKTLGPCYGLDWAVAIGIESRGSQLDKYGTVIVPKEKSRCVLTSFVRSDAPPSLKKGGDAEASKPAPTTPPPG